MRLISKKLTQVLSYSLLLIATTHKGYSASADKEATNISRFVKTQLSNNTGLEPVIQNLITRFPANTTNTIQFFAENYPSNHKQMFNAIANTNPVFLPDALMMYLTTSNDDKYSIIAAAIQAEPSYADSLVETLLDHYPENAETIIETAMIAGPQSADQVIQIVSDRFPDRVIEFVKLAFSHIPFFGPYIVESLVASSPNRSFELLKQSMPLVTNDSDAYEKLMNCAKNAGLSEDEIQQLAQFHQ